MQAQLKVRGRYGKWGETEVCKMFLKTAHHLTSKRKKLNLEWMEGGKEGERVRRTKNLSTTSTRGNKKEY